MNWDQSLGGCQLAKGSGTTAQGGQGPGWLSSRAVLREEKEEQVLWLSACYHVFMLISYNVMSCY